MKMIMNMKAIKTLAFAAAVTLACSAGVSFGDILDEGLGPKAPAPTETNPTPPPAAPASPAIPEKPAAAPPPPAPQPTRPKMNDLVSPNAAKTVDDQDIIKKLTGDGIDDGGQGGGPEQKMIEVMDRMGQAQTRLSKQKDPGLVTQETQQRIVTDLDSTIEYLRKQDQKGGQGSGKPKPGQGQKKQESKGNKQGSAPGSGKGGTTAATNSEIKAGSADPMSSNDTPLNQTGTNWGNLPPGDRALVAHGASEQYLPEYKEMIKRYYEALAEIGRNSGNH